MAPGGATADVVIIGGGVMGASAAYHLARRGARVTLLEAESMFGTGSTGTNAGGFRHQFSTGVNIEFSKQSVAMLERFPDEMEQSVDLKFCGYLFLLDSPEDIATFRRNVELQHRHGVMTRWLTPGDAAELAPAVDLDGVLAATFYERDGLVDPSGVLQGYVRGARRAGAQLLTDAKVTGAAVRNGTITAVETTAGLFSGGAYLLAAGPWSGTVGACFGIEIPIRPIRRQVAVTGPLPEIPRDFPFVIDFAQSLYFHREGAGILTGMSNRDEPVGFSTAVDESWRAHHVEAAVHRLPALADAVIASEWAGLYEVTPDDQAILGRVPRLENLYVCAGFSGHGLMHGPAAGLVISEEILDGRAQTIDIAPLRWRAFASHTGEYNVI